VGLNPEVGHEEMAGLNFAHGISQALWHDKLFHVDLNGQHGPRFDQDLRFGAGNVRGAFWTVDALLGAGTGKAYDGYVHFDFKPPRAEAEDGVWESARGCMRNYLILRDKVQAFRADPDVVAALEAAEVGTLRTPTLAEGESLADLRAASYDVEGLGARSVGQEALDQLALEHLMGVR
jgi:xylose isomerase